MYLSPKKKRFVNFIKFFILDNDRPPTFVEIMEGLEIKSLGTINWYVNELETAGVLKRMNGFNGKRALSVLEKKIENTLPLIGLISAGYPLEVFNDIDYIEVPKSFFHPNNFLLRVNGNSMTDESIVDGDLIIVKKTPNAKNGDIVVAYINNEATLKVLFKSKNKIELHPRNKNYNVIKITKSDDFKIGGVMLGLIRHY